MKQKIIFCIPELLIGGVETALCELLLGLNQLDLYDISVITKKYTAKERFDAFFKNNNITVYDLSLRWRFFKFIERPIQKLLIKRILKTHDVIVDFKYTEFLKYHHHIDKPKICWLHCSSVNFKNNIDLVKVINYNKIICVSKQLSEYIQEFYSELNGKSISRYNPINLIELVQASKESLCPTNNPYFVAVQRFERKEKDIATIIKAFNFFSKSNPNYYLYIVGSGESDYRKYLESICESKNIIFTGSLKNSYAIIKNAEALILSSTREIGEGMPVVLQEAHALGTLAISSNVPSGPAEILMNGDAGFLFEQGNYEELAEILATVVQNKELCQKKIDCATKNLHRFDPEVSAQAFVKVIESLNLNK